MSTVFFTDGRKSETAAGKGLGRPQGAEALPQLRCGLCRGELYPGDPYFELDGRVVCEDCLGRYARGYFIHRLRRVSRRERDDTL